MKISILYLNDENRIFEPVLNAASHFEKTFDIYRVTNSKEAVQLLRTKNISVIVSSEINDETVKYKYSDMLKILPNYLVIRWINFYQLANHTNHSLANEIMEFYLRAITQSVTLPFFSVITPLYHTKDYQFKRAYLSLKEQTNKHWEWILVDDSLDKTKTEYIQDLLNEYNDPRVKYYSFPHSGVIGNVKKKGFNLSSGDLLVEFDHDDLLMPQALEHIRSASNIYKDAGFFYSDCAEITLNSQLEPVGFRNYARENGIATKNPWGYSKTGRAEDFEYHGFKCLSNVGPTINSQSIRDITNSPNHYRCWKSDVYFKIAGHNENLPVADDYELMVKTFLATKMVHINNTDYIQFYDESGNTQYDRNLEIHRLTWYISKHYNLQIHNRFLELGIDDYCWDEKTQTGLYNLHYPSIDHEKTKANYTIKF